MRALRALALGLSSILVGSSCFDERILREYEMGRTEAEGCRIDAALRGTFRQEGSTYVVDSPFALQLHFRREVAEGGAVRITGLKVYDGAVLVHEERTPVERALETSSEGRSTAHFTFDPVDLPHKRYKVEVSFELRLRESVKTGAAEIVMEPAFKQYRGSNFLDRCMSV